MTINEIKDECQKAILWAERAENGPWRAVLTGDSYHIAHARTFAPAAARALLEALSTIENQRLRFELEHFLPGVEVTDMALSAICAQFEP